MLCRDLGWVYGAWYKEPKVTRLRGVRGEFGDVGSVLAAKVNTLMGLSGPADWGGVHVKEVAAAAAVAEAEVTGCDSG
jgi:hypothetical protein